MKGVAGAVIGATARYGSGASSGVKPAPLIVRDAP